ncbi:hypothetical protein [Acetobacter pasteurianus]|uniref:hypothetical protein n=1 Tax=Acetobacter pasteurianus TaxID=438 RepID=UPI0003841BC9|nr:hypothetical protein [Acetobacter pasteurianus]CCT58494.1 hypothetical protein APA386B_376 [Acetobacter pasteurianus 386B]
MTGLNLSQFKSLIVRPALAGAGLGGEAAVNLLTGTCLVESGLSWLEQVRGPALGIAQMEPATHDDCWVNYLRYQQDTANHILATCGLSGLPDASVMVWNLRYAVLMARVRYIRAPAPLPDAANAAALSTYHKQHYNTALGQANASANISLFQQAIAA